MCSEGEMTTGVSFSKGNFGNAVIIRLLLLQKYIITNTHEEKIDKLVKRVNTKKPTNTS